MQVIESIENSVGIGFDPTRASNFYCEMNQLAARFRRVPRVYLVLEIDGRVLLPSTDQIRLE